MFGDNEIEKQKFYHYKNTIFNDNILISKKISSVEKIYKYFIGYMVDYCKIKPLCISLLKTSAYVKIYDGETKWIYFLTEDGELLKKYNDTWNKVSNSIKSEFVLAITCLREKFGINLPNSLF